MGKALLVLAWAVMWLASIQSCSYTDEPQPPPILREMSSSAGVSDVLNRVGQIVILKGSFQGWEVGSCRFAEGVASKGQTRGDWLIRTGSDCYYVTGGFPPGLDALNSEHIGVRILLKARVVRDESWNIYLVYSSARRAD